MSRHVRSDQGTALLETSLALPLLIVIVSGLLATIYLSFARIWFERNGYEALICLSTSTQAFRCEQEFRERIADGLPIGWLESVRLTRSRKHASIQASFAVSGTTVFRSRNELVLPLQAEKGRNNHGSPF